MILKVPDFNPIKGTSIMFQDRLEWFVKYPDGFIISCSNPKYAEKYSKKFSSVVIDDPEDDAYIMSLNNGYFTLVDDKIAINRPNLLTFENTTEWLPMSGVKDLAKATNFFCQMASNFYNPYVINRLLKDKKL